VNKFFGLILTMILVLSTMNAEAARRMGGGKSTGQQSSNVTQREAVKPAPAALAKLPRLQTHFSHSSSQPQLSAHGVPCWVAWRLV
jgi:hypothetical protein